MVLGAASGEARAPAATSLRAIYHDYGDPIDLRTVIAEIPALPTGGTLGIHLSLHALRRGYEVDAWVCNVNHFDPTGLRHRFPQTRYLGYALEVSQTVSTAAGWRRLGDALAASLEEALAG